MRRMHYAGGYVLMADTMAKAILRYGRALAENGHFDVVAVPVFTEQGQAGVAHIFLGPSSQLFSVPVATGGKEPVDTELLEHLERRTEGLQPSRPEWRDELVDVSELPVYRVSARPR